MERKDAFLVLPVTVAGRVDVGRLRREVEAIDNFLAQSAIREPGTPMKLPKTSRMLDETIMTNKLNMLVQEDRDRLLHFLMEVYARAPMMHISFGADPSAAFTQKITAWIRSEIHPLALIQVGLQPNIGAGCMLRTTNKYFDFSLRSRLHERRDVMMQKMREAMGMATPTQAQLNQPVVVQTVPVEVK